MAYVPTGTKRSLTFTVLKTVGGVPGMGYPKTYNGKLAFPGYAAITDLEAQQLTGTQYNTRLAAYYAYVESIDSGFDSETDFTNPAIVVDLVTCPPPTTTTTTTVVITTTTTTCGGGIGCMIIETDFIVG